MQNLKPYLQEMFGAKTQPLRDVLCEHRNANVHWRYLDEESFALYSRRLQSTMH